MTGPRETPPEQSAAADETDTFQPEIEVRGERRGVDVEGRQLSKSSAR